jgi:hypothetical protein
MEKHYRSLYDEYTSSPTTVTFACIRLVAIASVMRSSRLIPSAVQRIIKCYSIGWDRTVIVLSASRSTASSPHRAGCPRVLAALALDQLQATFDED